MRQTTAPDCVSYSPLVFLSWFSIMAQRGRAMSEDVIFAIATLVFFVMPVAIIGGAAIVARLDKH